MTSPVFQALVNARLQQLSRDEAVIAEDVSAVLGPLPPDTHRPQRFIGWCDEQGLPWRPASPPVIAKFVLGYTKIGNLVDELRTLGLAHTTQGLPDPCTAYQVTAALSRLVDVGAPRSWPKEMQVLFLSLPEDIRQCLHMRERDRDAAIRRTQTDAALWRRHVENEKPKEENVAIIEKQPDQIPVA
jgi:hypothetical protein